MPKIALNPKSKLGYVSLAFLGTLVILSYVFALFFKATPPHISMPVGLKIQKTSLAYPQGPLYSQSTSSRPQEEATFVEMATAHEMCTAFDKCGFELSKVVSGENGVPRIYLTKLPSDLKGLPPKHKRNAFIKSILPLVLAVNEEIRSDREKLVSLQKRLDKGGHLRAQERSWLHYLASAYKLKSHDIKVLLKHVDEIPPSLALAQAAIESGWGTSSAARKKHSTFGHMETKTKVKAFDNLHQNVNKYAKNLNTHGAYKGFREARAKMRLTGENICGFQLASHLLKYSVRGSAYTHELQKMIKRLDLHHFDAAHIRFKP